MKILSIILLLFSTTAHSRIFKITEAGFATYFKGSFGTSALQKHPYEKSSGAQTLFTDEIDYNFGGELGFMFPSKHYSFRMGLQILAPHSPAGVKGKNSSGTELMSLDTSIYGFFPMAHFEYYVVKNSWGRMLLSVGGGLGKVSLKNTYTLTSDGEITYSPLTSFTEKASQYTYIVETSVGWETSFVQSVTVSFDLGYRYAVARELEYDTSGTNFGGSYSEGGAVLNSDGHRKILDLSGIFTGLSFRFYFD